MATIELQVRLQRSPREGANWCAYTVRAEGRETLSDLLRSLGEDATRAPAFDAPCGEGLCGACAVRLEGRLVLACRAEVPLGHPGPLRVEPAGPFVMRDLILDRGFIDAGFQEVMTEGESCWEDGETACLRCGLCIEACPSTGHDRRAFLGAGPLHEALVTSATKEDVPSVLFGARGVGACRAIGNCERVCPVQLPLRTSLERLGRLRLQRTLRNLIGE